MIIACSECLKVHKLITAIDNVIWDFGNYYFCSDKEDKSKETCCFYIELIEACLIFE